MENQYSIFYTDGFNEKNDKRQRKMAGEKAVVTEEIVTDKQRARNASVLYMSTYANTDMHTHTAGPHNYIQSIWIKIIWDFILPII